MDELGTKLAELADKLGPQVVELARDAALFEASSNMILYVIGLFFWAAALGLIVWFFWEMKDNDRLIANSEAGTVIVAVIAFIGGIFALAAWVVCIAGILAPWNWVALVNPDLYIAKKVLGL